MTSNLIDRVEGRPLVGITYLGLPWDPTPADTQLVDVVNRAVVLDFDGLRLAVRWDLRPPVERLAVESYGESSAVAPLTTSHDVSHRWRSVIGGVLNAHAWGWHEVESGTEVWAVALRFSNAQTLFIALGELVEGAPIYLPDSLVVTASERIAKAYRPRAALNIPWDEGGAGMQV